VFDRVILTARRRFPRLVQLPEQRRGEHLLVGL
jgi:hypothetical protein